MDDEDTDALANKDLILLREFSKFGKVAYEFDKLFGTH